MMPRHSLRQRAAALIVVYAMVLAGCGGGVKTSAPLQPGASAFPQPTGYNMFSVDQEVQLGKQAEAEADAQLPLLPARGEVSDFVSTLGQKLARNLPDNPYQFNFKVINQKEINAFALPGGPIRVNLGTIQSAQNEAQVAGVIAHEIAHVYLRHSTRQASKAQIAQIPAAILGGIAGNGAAGQLARLGLQLGLGSAFLKYSRDAESEADYVGAKLMYETGYDPHEMARFFDRLAEESGASGGPQFLSDHPNPGNRSEAVTKAIAQLPPKQFVKNTPLFTEAKSAASKMKPLSAQQIAQAAAQKQGKIDQVSQQSIKPAGSFTELNHSFFQIQYPSNWKAFGEQNGPVTIAPEAGVSQSAIAYGVVISGYQPQGQQSLDQSAQQIYEGLRQSNPQMQAAGQLQRTQVNGMPAVAIDLQSPSPLTTSDGQTVAERDKLVCVQRQDGSVLWLLFIAPERDFNALSSTYQQMLQSLRIG
jgi:Zn-dependent protease with chaperone function